MSPSDAFDPLRIALERAGIRYGVGGSWASSAFGDPRFTNDVDILAELTVENLDSFLSGLTERFYFDAEEARAALLDGRSFNVIDMAAILKFDLFPAAAFPLGKQELDRTVMLNNTGLSKGPTPFVSPEDILLAKLYWFRLGDETSQVQWRDALGIVRAGGSNLDRGYLERSAAELRVRDLLDRAFRADQSN